VIKKYFALMIGVAFLSQPVLAESFDCTMGLPKSVTINGDKAETAPLNINGKTPFGYTFRLSFAQKRKDELPEAAIDWPNSPIQVSGRYPAIPTANNSYTITTINPGPCLFTDTACTTMINFVGEPDGSAKVIMYPAALTTTDEKQQLKEPFIVVLQGSCVKGKS
jgi:hypothetical protein